MKTTISCYDFHNAFRSVRPDNFSHAGLDTLFDYLEELENDLGEEIELDVIALCCEYSEYKSLKDFQRDYSDSYETIEDIERETFVLRIDDNGFIIQNF